MSSRFWTSLICSTALVTCVAVSASAGDVFMVQLASPTVENTTSHQTNSGSSRDLSRSADSSTVIIQSDPDMKPLPMIGKTPAKSVAKPQSLLKTQSVATASEPAAADPKPAATPESTTKVEPTGVQAASVPTQPEPTVVTAAPATSDTPANPMETAKNPESASGHSTAPVEAAVPTTTDTSSTTASVPSKTPAAPEPRVPVVTAKAPAPVETQPAAPAPLATAAVAPAAIAPVNPTPSAPVDTPAAAPAPVQPTVAVPAAAPAAAPAPAAPVQAAITQEMIAAVIKNEVDARFLVGKPADEKKLTAEEKKARAAIVAFYNSRNDQPLWVDAQGFDQAASEAIVRLGRAQEDGLNPADYPVPNVTGNSTAEALGKAEIELTLSTMKYARQAQAGRFEPSRLGELVTEKPPVPDPNDVLKSFATSTNVSQTLEAYNPPHEGYKRLKAKLAELLEGKPLVPQARVPSGPTIRPGEKDMRVALLRNRLGVTGTATADDSAIYDDSLVDAVKSFQKTRGLKPSGLIGQQTVDAINNDMAGSETRAADIIANMERWRWLARDLGQMHVMVNVPDFSLTVVRDGVVTHKARAIVGRVANPTPIFSETMTHIIVNPYWNVPISIVKKEYLAKAQETNGAALERGNFEVEVGNKTVDPTTVDWSTVSASQVHLRQRPGAGNALGNIKFMFPNQHSVYIHDTSSRGLFVQDYRSLSHGCVRVQDPFAFADALLAEEPTGITGAKLKSMIGGSEKYLWLKKQIPVHIAYFTDFVDDNGVLQTRPDLYGHNARTKQLLGL